MASNLTSGSFRIVSLVKGNPLASVGLGFSGVQVIFLNGQVTTWNVEKVGENTYQLSIGPYPYVGVLGKRVAASIHPEENTEWIITYREAQDAYTISPINDRIKGWTVPADDEHNLIILKPIVSTRSLPPRFLPAQLFRFAALDE